MLKLKTIKQIIIIWQQIKTKQINHYNNNLITTPNSYLYPTKIKSNPHNKLHLVNDKILHINQILLNIIHKKRQKLLKLYPLKLNKTKT